jgi:hypothetical protein
MGTPMALNKSSNFSLPFLSWTLAKNIHFLKPWLRKLLLLPPLSPLAVMSSFCPPPYRLENTMIHIGKSFAGHNMTEMICPPPNPGVQVQYQIFCFDHPVGFDNPPDIIQEDFNILLGGFARTINERYRTIPSLAINHGNIRGGRYYH